MTLLLIFLSNKINHCVSVGLTHIFKRFRELICNFVIGFINTFRFWLDAKIRLTLHFRMGHRS